ncbi:MAG: hypothetical protein ACREJB_19285, partial [Planctomycetaceae bacterium]
HYITESTTVENLERQLGPFLQRTATPALTVEQRAARSQAAAYWLAHIASGRRGDLFDITQAEQALLSAMGDAELASNALIALGSVPSAQTQQQMYAVAVNAAFDPALREAAAVQLAFHIQRFGLMLTNAQAAEILSVWRAETDPGLSSALASVVGSLQPNSRRVAERLEQLAEPAQPAP